jgi:hypothetical protein
MTSIARNLPADVLRIQTHIFQKNIFENTHCSHCHKKGHNILFCLDISIRIILEEVIQKFICYDTTKISVPDKINYFLYFIKSYNIASIKKLCVHFDIHTKNCKVKICSIYNCIRLLILEEKNIILPELPTRLASFIEKKPIVDISFTFPHNSRPVYSIELYYDSPTFNIAGCFAFASNILLKYGNYFTRDPHISLTHFIEYLFYDISRWLYDDQVLNCFQYYNINGLDYYGFTLEYFNALINNGCIYQFEHLPTYLAGQIELHNLYDDDNVLLRQYTRIIQPAVPSVKRFLIHCIVVLPLVAESKTMNIPLIFHQEQIEKKHDSDSKGSDKKEIECIEEEKEEIEIVECPICISEIDPTQKIVINCNHIYCNNCMILYLNKVSQPIPTCSLCRSPIHTIQGTDSSIQTLKSQTSFHIC